MLTDAQIMQEFEAAEAILSGHFILSSGLHSERYLQCARVLMNAKRAEKLCGELARKVREALGSTRIDYVVAPAMGGVVVGYEMARQLGVDGMFCERQDGAFALRRGFALPEGANVLVVEDVVTTGKSSLEAYNCIREAGAVIVGEACLVDRSNGTAEAGLGVPLISLVQLDVKTYDPKALPTHLKDVPAVKPGSRWLQK